MPQFEYRCWAYGDLEDARDTFNEWGRQGWEMVSESPSQPSMGGRVAWFKRELSVAVDVSGVPNYWVTTIADRSHD